MIVSIAEIRSVQPYSTKPTHKHTKRKNNKQQILQEKTEKEIGKATVMKKKKKKKNYWKMEEKE